MHFLDEVLFQKWCILMIFFLMEDTSYFGHFVFMCHSSTFFFHSNNTSFTSFMFFLAGFNKIVM